MDGWAYVAGSLNLGLVSIAHSHASNIVCTYLLLGVYMHMRCNLHQSHTTLERGGHLGEELIRGSLRELDTKTQCLEAWTWRARLALVQHATHPLRAGHATILGSIDRVVEGHRSSS